MAALDTNVLVRLLVGDDRVQLQLALKLIESTSAKGDLLFIPLTVTVELEWVLRSQYGYAKTEIIAAYIGLLEARELQFQDEASIEQALFFFEESNVDFADCLHAALATVHGFGPLLTFDRRASKLPDADLVD